MAIGLTIFVSVLLILLCYVVWANRTMKHAPKPLPVTPVPVAVIEGLEQSIGGQLPVALRMPYIDGKIVQVNLPVFLQWQGCEYGIDQFFQADPQQNRKLAEVPAAIGVLTPEINSSLRISSSCENSNSTPGSLERLCRNCASSCALLCAPVH